MGHDPRQYRMPAGPEGKLLLEDMNVHHRGLTEWALDKLPAYDPADILDIGCGGGMLISLLASRFTKAVIRGIDISEESVKMTNELNADIVAEGRCLASVGSVSDIPFDDGAFGLVTAFETYFFWPDLLNDIKKAAAKVREGGYIVIVSETYPHPAFRERNDQIVKDYGLNIIENEEMVSMLEECGVDTTVHEDEEKNWVAFVGRKR